ncbi:MAG: class I SAM-dependent methyltransferase [Candidatus Thermoplasmatota archaeon]|jgi:2-polyprenyl-3-methyl-5-hydroxy-6-metoxy-1,4-benzoquinol methylase|nr:class I SAM-dependent methyltransferase [Candidatus Thermoplasmatota archaeon]
MDKAIKFWDKQAKGYDASEKKFEPAFELILNRTKKYLKRSDNILDFGCATGSKTFQLAPFVRNVLCNDISPMMIELAKKKAEDLAITNADFLTGTIFDETLTTDSFDVIVSFGLLHLLKDNEGVMKRVDELLKPGGYFISTTACLKENMSLKSKIEFAMYMFIKRIGLFPLYLNMYRCSDVIDIVSNDFDIIECENMFHDIHICYIVSKKR